MALRTVAIVGRPNVGKSTLFNRILRRRVAIVAERPGVTRDRQFAEAEWAGRRFLLVDTGGLVEGPEGQIDQEVRRQAETAIGHADAVILVVDGREGVQPVDRHVGDLLRRSGLPVIVAVNKLDELGGAVEHIEFYELGLGDPLPLAALSGKGSGDLLDRVVEALPEAHEAEGGGADLRAAVIGRPNVGKSSFVNRLLGEERVIVHEKAGTTRDAIDTELEIGDRRVCLIDTAGLRRQARIEDDLEFLGRLRAASAIERADVCLLLVDTEAGAANQDFRIGHQAWDAGKGLVFVANKWDLIEDRGPSAMAGFERELRERAHYLRWVPIITCSALSGKRVRKVIELAFAAQEERARRIPTAEVNKVLRDLVARRQPPQGGRGDVRLLYGSQVASSPPLFVLWSNRPHDLKEHYVRYLVAGFREAWGFEGSPIRIKLKQRSERA
ncbi:ribosome biogenesis GTPase Der [Candidatus Palauibacter sp.]|uniref:ribosome biogenesis GTPase Der n=1 Tax=Candidatus Palauibacter sp. TaxID=3101350 RepID=UPI003B01AE13